MDDQSPSILAADSDSGEEFARPVDDDFFNDSDADSDFVPKTPNMYISSTIISQSNFNNQINQAM
jgi:hypothetical protein